MLPKKPVKVRGGEGPLISLRDNVQTSFPQFLSQKQTRIQGFVWGQRLRFDTHKALFGPCL